jgi:hypothetical protein
VSQKQLHFRSEPKGKIIGQLAQNQRVYIANEGLKRKNDQNFNYKVNINY